MVLWLRSLGLTSASGPEGQPPLAKQSPRTTPTSRSRVEEFTFNLNKVGKLRCQRLLICIIEAQRHFDVFICNFFGSHCSRTTKQAANASSRLERDAGASALPRHLRCLTDCIYIFHYPFNVRCFSSLSHFLSPDRWACWHAFWVRISVLYMYDLVLLLYKLTTSLSTFLTLIFDILKSSFIIFFSSRKGDDLITVISYSNHILCTFQKDVI